MIEANQFEILSPTVPDQKIKSVFIFIAAVKLISPSLRRLSLFSASAINVGATVGAGLLAVT